MIGDDRYLLRDFWHSAYDSLELHNTTSLAIEIDSKIRASGRQTYHEGCHEKDPT